MKQKAEASIQLHHKVYALVTWSIAAFLAYARDVHASDARQGSKPVPINEATSSVDGETEKPMQRLIRDEFKKPTIVAVVHRLGAIMKNNIVLVLDANTLVEVRPPSI
jgi:hypothetical protein